MASAGCASAGSTGGDIYSRSATGRTDRRYRGPSAGPLHFSKRVAAPSVPWLLRLCRRCRPRRRRSQRGVLSKAGMALLKTFAMSTDLCSRRSSSTASQSWSLPSPRCNARPAAADRCAGVRPQSVNLWSILDMSFVRSASETPSAAYGCIIASANSVQRLGIGVVDRYDLRVLAAFRNPRQSAVH